MSDTENETEAPGAAAETSPAVETDAADATTEAEKPNREAAKYRRRLREAETERDALRGQVEALQRAEVERIASASLNKPEALWAAGVELPDVLDAEGRPDPEKVTQAVREASERLGLAQPPPAMHVPGEGSSQRPPVRGGFEDALSVYQMG